jgi:hypothetical protein
MRKCISLAKLVLDCCRVCGDIMDMKKDDKAGKPAIHTRYILIILRHSGAYNCQNQQIIGTLKT